MPSQFTTTELPVVKFKIPEFAAATKSNNDGAVADGKPGRQISDTLVKPSGQTRKLVPSQFTTTELPPAKFKAPGAAAAVVKEMPKSIIRVSKIIIVRLYIIPSFFN